MLQIPSLRRAAVLAAASAALLLSACGGGGGGSGDSAAAGATASRAGSFTPSVSLANMCPVEDQKRWVRSYLDENYLWTDEIVDVDASAHSTPASYFDALLVRSRDRFSTSMSTATANAMQGIVASSTPAAATTAAAANPVPLVRTYTAGTRKIGYVLFNEHSRGAQDALITAFASLKTANVDDLVLDLRYNAGGFLYIAQAAAAMIAPPSVDGQVFESLRYSNRRSAENGTDTYYFRPRVLLGETTYPADHAFPRLSLTRVYVLTSGYTCSASESIINGLRGVGVQVILVGDKTCGKPYGFHRMDNCGQAYFPIEFQMLNAQGFGDYASGFPVQCRVPENPATALGATNEPLLAAAFNHIQTGNCPAGTSTGIVGVVVQEQVGPSPFERPGAPSPSSPMYQPGFNGRLLAN